MFIVSLTYIVPPEQVDAQLAAHRGWLAEHYGAGVFLMSGRKVPREGGIIIANANSREAIEALVRSDPFHIAGVARYEITEFVPTMTADLLAAFREG